MVARLRTRVGLDEAIGGALAAVALVLMLLIGIHDSRRPVYGPIDELTHTAYVLAVASDGIPPEVGRDRAFVRAGPLAPRDVRVPPPDKIGSAPLPIGSFGEVKQAEGIQPPLYYYAAAPLTWFVSGRDKVVALRLFDVFLYLCAAMIIFLAVCDIGGTVLGGGIATLLFASANGLMDVLSYVTNGTMMLLLGAAAIWLSLRGIRDRRLTWPLTFVAAGLAITHIIVVPLAALCLLAPAVAQIRARGRGVRRPVAKRVIVAAIPLSLWVLSNLVRYHWVVPQAPGVNGIGGLGSATTVNVNVYEFAAQFYLSFITSIQDLFHPLVTSPYVYDWRPLALFVPLTLIGLACALLRGTARQRQAIALWLVAIVAAHLSVFLMLYLAVILTGGGDFVFRYFTAEQAAVACLAGTCFGLLFRNPVLMRSATVIVGLALAYWTYSASPL
jgi:hypothetical protein